MIDLEDVNDNSSNNKSYEDSERESNNNNDFESHERWNLWDNKDIFVNRESILIIDIGTNSIKAGYSLNKEPSIDLLSLVGYPKKYSNNPHLGEYYNQQGFLKEKKSSETAIYGYDTLNKHIARDLELVHPLEKGIIKEWEATEHIILNIFDILGTDSDDESIIVTAHPNTDIIRLSQILFETLMVGDSYIKPQEQFALYYSQQSTGLVVHVGDYCSIMPFYCNEAMNHLYTTFPIDGTTLTQNIIDDIDWKEHEHIFGRIDERNKYMISQLLKENVFYVSNNENEKDNSDNLLDKKLFDINNLDTHSSIPLKFISNQKINPEYLLQLVKDRSKHTEKFFMGNEGKNKNFVSNSEFIRNINNNNDDSSNEKKKKLNRRMIEGNGIHVKIYNTIMKAPKEIRSLLFSNIIVEGGSSQFPGFVDRLKSEIENLIKTNKYVPNYKVNMMNENANDSKCSFINFKGAVKIANSSVLPSININDSTYDDVGANYVEDLFGYKIK
eukprot:TRINITY_DN1564_c1_g2_i1.p1 TRINITY_DN1564_c1_g2~~TRINITY_DN1564_c1_g2_i1.p1  ORF type:complete len:557 (-),score=162.88 TRINITY_DN1564_c1_g2_i1:190-1686(-)